MGVVLWEGDDVPEMDTETLDETLDEIVTLTDGDAVNVCDDGCETVTVGVVDFR